MRSNTKHLTMYSFSDLLSRKLHKLSDNKASVKLLPDYGTHYVKSFGVKPLIAQIQHPSVVIGSREDNICWVTCSYIATLITSKDFGRLFQHCPCALNIIPDPSDAYTTPLGERVVPFKLVGDDERSYALVTSFSKKVKKL